MYDGGSKVVGYIVERKPVSEVGDGRWLKCNYTIVSDNFFTVTALSEGDTYEFRVLAKNAAGVISKGSESTGPVTCRDEYGKKQSTFPFDLMAHKWISELSDVQPYLFCLLTAPPKAELDARLQGELVTIRAGSDLVLDAAVGGKPEPKIIWTKGDKELDLCEKVSLQYTGKRATAVIKYCDRSDSGKYTLTVKNASGTKSVSVMVKVLGT